MRFKVEPSTEGEGFVILDTWCLKEETRSACPGFTVAKVYVREWAEHITELMNEANPEIDKTRIIPDGPMDIYDSF